MPQLHIFQDNPSFVRGAADFIDAHAAQAIAARGCFTLALAGGGTPKPIYARLATAEYRTRTTRRRCPPQRFIGCAARTTPRARRWRTNKNSRNCFARQRFRRSI
ncbi:hypothetical protein FBQ82_22675 [Anaerolineae bacterium CFX7]|nr:hypothetical protein [Anaerolineae bacterium CFX7]